MARIILALILIAPGAFAAVRRANYVILFLGDAGEIPTRNFQRSACGTTFSTGLPYGIDCRPASVADYFR
jgi:hypothetical protein